jgi:hypothetical protein
MGMRRSSRIYPFEPQTSVFPLADEEIVEGGVSRKKRKADPQKASERKKRKRER